MKFFLSVICFGLLWGCFVEKGSDTKGFDLSKAHDPSAPVAGGKAGEKALSAYVSLRAKSAEDGDGSILMFKLAMEILFAADSTVKNIKLVGTTERGSPLFWKSQKYCHVSLDVDPSSVSVDGTLQLTTLVDDYNRPYSIGIDTETHELRKLALGLGFGYGVGYEYDKDDGIGELELVTQDNRQAFRDKHFVESCEARTAREEGHHSWYSYYNHHILNSPTPSDPIHAFVTLVGQPPYYPPGYTGERVSYEGLESKIALQVKFDKGVAVSEIRMSQIDAAGNHDPCPDIVTADDSVGDHLWWLAFDPPHRRRTLGGTAKYGVYGVQSVHVGIGARDRGLVNLSIYVGTVGEHGFAFSDGTVPLIMGSNELQPVGAINVVDTLDPKYITRAASCP